MVRQRVLVTLIVGLSFAPLFEGSRSVAGTRIERASSERTLYAARFLKVSGNRRFDVLTALGPWVSSDSVSSFGSEQAAFIRDWFLRQAKLGALPLEMIKHEAAPPLQRDGILPPDLMQRIQPLPIALECQLPDLSGNLRRVVVLGDVVLLEDDTSRIVDLIPGVL